MKPFARDDCISQLECNGENDPSLADRTTRCPRGATGVLAHRHNSQIASGLQIATPLENEVAQRRQKLAPRVSAGNIAGKKPRPLQGTTPDGRGRQSLQKQKGRPKAALKNHSKNP